MSGHIRRRRNKRGVSYEVIYRTGGRGHRVRHGGSFPTMKLARLRLDTILGWLAQGRNPDDELAALRLPPARKTIEDWYAAFIASRVDVTRSAEKLYNNSRRQFVPLLNDIPPERLTASDIQEAVNTLMETLAATTIKHYTSTLGQVLDHAGIFPNPVRSPQLRLPRQVREEVVVPTQAEWLLIRDAISPKYLLLIRLLECLGLRGAEAISLRFSDIDFAHGKLRVSKARTKGRTAGQRWLPVPPELLDEMSDRCPLEDRHLERRVFHDLTADRLRASMRLACRNAGVVSHHPHELRHRRISLWLAHGIDPVQAKTWSGHTKTSMTLDVYSHVMTEPHLDDWRGFWIDSYRDARGERFPELERDSQWVR